MKPETVNIIDTVLASDAFVSPEQRGSILAVCRGEARKGEGADDLQMHSAKNVADKLKVSEKTVKRWLATKGLKSHKFGKLRRIYHYDLVAFLQSFDSQINSGLASTPMENSDSI